MDEIKIRRIKSLMLGINITAVLFIVIVIQYTTKLLVLSGRAERFLDTVDRIPQNPSLLLYKVLAMCCCFFCMYIIRQYIKPESLVWIHISMISDFFISLLLVRLLNCNYNGLILWMLANIVYYIDNKWKYPAVALGIFIYMFTDFQIVSVYYSLFSVRSYILFYGESTRNLLFVLYSFLSTLNLISFIVFCIYVIQQQKGIIEEINGLYKKLSKANEELKQYADIKEKMGETKERNRLAREIHDTIGHSLTEITVGIEACLSIFDINPAAAKQQLKVVSSVAQEGMADVRRSVSSLRPDYLSHLKLTQRLEYLVQKAVDSTGVEIHFECPPGLVFDDDEENTVFRIVQESMTNAIRHGKAHRIDITVVYENSTVTITVKDNGIGCENMVSGFGTKHMQERVEILHGKIEFISKDGFTVHACVPIRREVLHAPEVLK